jgi:hypothetical protein
VLTDSQKGDAQAHAYISRHGRGRATRGAYLRLRCGRRPLEKRQPNLALHSLEEGLEGVLSGQGSEVTPLLV